MVEKAATGRSVGPRFAKVQRKSKLCPSSWLDVVEVILQKQLAPLRRQNDHPQLTRHEISGRRFAGIALDSISRLDSREEDQFLGQNGCRSLD